MTKHRIESYWILLYIAVHSQYIFMDFNIMATAKTATLTFRIEPELKEALREASIRERRSIANMVEILIRDYCGQNGIVISEHNESMVATIDDNERTK